MAARTSKEAEILTPQQALAFIDRHGVVCEAAHHAAIPSLVAAIAGEPMRGNWWSHPRGKQIFAITRAVRDAREILVCRLVEGKITFVHERLWPALVRLADRFPRARLARLHEVHSASGKHIIEETPFPDWVPATMIKAAKRLKEPEAKAEIAAAL